MCLNFALRCALSLLVPKCKTYCHYETLFSCVLSCSTLFSLHCALSFLLLECNTCCQQERRVRFVSCITLVLPASHHHAHTQMFTPTVVFSKYTRPQVVEPIVKSIATRSTLSFLGESFYGGAEGCSNGKGHTPAGVCGYEPREAGLAAAGLRYLRDVVAGPTYADVPLEFQEYGTLGNKNGRVSPEPGAFGAAWTVATSVVAAAGGVSRAFHWANHDTVGPTGAQSRRLYYSNAWVSAMLCLLFGEDAALGSIRILTPSVGHDSSSVDPGMITHSRLQSDTISPPAAFGVGGRAAGRAAGSAFLLSIFSADKLCTTRTTATVTFDCPATGCPHTPPVITARAFNKSTSTYDVIHAAAESREWLTYADGEVYSLNQMLNANGTAAFATLPVATEFRKVQARAFAPVEDPAAAGVSVRCSNMSCTLTVSAAPPAVFAITVTWV
jgi:hypothetical protein